MPNVELSIIVMSGTTIIILLAIHVFYVISYIIASYLAFGMKRKLTEQT
jgi:hypothetical protein